MSEEQNEDGVIRFTRPIDGQLKSHLPVKLEIDKSWVNKCRHDCAIVDREGRTVKCKSCGVNLDPIDVLVKIAYRERTTDERIEEIRKHDAACARAADLKKERDKESAQRRLMQLPIGEHVWIEDDGPMRGGRSGVFHGIHDGVVVLGWPREKEPIAQIPVENVTVLRKLRRRIGL